MTVSKMQVTLDCKVSRDSSLEPEHRGIALLFYMLFGPCGRFVISSGYYL